MAGFVTRDSSVDELLAVLEAAMVGEIRCSPRITGTLFRRVSTLAARRETGSIGNLTAREMDVLRCIERGLSNKEISRDLGIELSTVKNHVHNLLDKLGVHRRGEAAAQLRDSGFGTPNKSILDPSWPIP